MGLLSWLMGKDEHLVVGEDEMLDSLSLNEVIHGHMQWKHRLESYRNGLSTEELIPEEIADCHTCQLGSWLYDSGKKNYSDTEEWKVLEKTHKKFHFLAGEIVEYIDAKKYDKADDLINREFEPLSREIKLDIAKLYRKSKL